MPPSLNAYWYAVHTIYPGEGLLIRSSDHTPEQMEGGLEGCKALRHCCWTIYSWKIPEEDQTTSQDCSRRWKKQDGKETVLSLIAFTNYLERQTQTHHMQGRKYPMSGTDPEGAVIPCGWRVV